MKSAVRPASFSKECPSKAAHPSANDTAPISTRPDSTYKSGNAVQTTGATSPRSERVLHRRAVGFDAVGARSKLLILGRARRSWPSVSSVEAVVR